MINNAGFERTVPYFGHYLEEQYPGRVLIAPGNSATLLSKSLKTWARSNRVTLPTLHEVDHNVSQSLEDGNLSGIPELYRDSRILFLDDFLMTGTKAKLIHDSLMRNYSIYSHFVIMVGARVDLSPYIDLFLYYPALATSLNNHFANRES